MENKKTRMTREELWNIVINRYPSLKVFNINGWYGGMYIKLGEIIKIINDLGIYNDGSLTDKEKEILDNMLINITIKKI